MWDSPKYNARFGRIGTVEEDSINIESRSCSDAFIMFQVLVTVDCHAVGCPQRNNLTLDPKIKCHAHLMMWRQRSTVCTM